MTAPTFRARFFFDAGSGCCLWGADDATKEEHDYPIDHHELGLPTALAAALDDLVARWDTVIDWDDPGGPSPWTHADHVSFDATVDAVLTALRPALPDWDVVDTHATADRFDET